MPEDIFKKIYINVNKEWKVAFLSAIILGIIIHLFVFTNIMPNHDGVNNFYNNADKSFSGRFFLQYFAGISSYFELPIINGILSIIYLSLMSIVIVEIFKLTKTLSIILTSGLIVTFPTVASTFSYMFTADGYMLSYLITTLAILITIKYKYGFIFGIILFYLSVGVYQANLPFILSLIVLLFTKELIFSNDNLKTQIINLSKQLAMVVLGMIAYVVTFKIHQQKGKIVAYQGLNESGSVTIGDIPKQFNLIIQSFKNFFIGNHTNLFELLNIALLIIILIGVVYILLKRANVMGFFKTLLVIISLISLPIMSYSLYFVSPGVKYHMLMVISLLVFYFIPIILYDNFTIKNKLTKFYSWLTIIIFTLIIFNFSLISNISYVNTSLKYEKSFALANRILSRIEQLEEIESINKIAVLGDANNYMESEFYKTFYKKTPPMTGVIGQSIITDSRRLKNTLDQFLGVEFNEVNSIELDKLENNIIVKEMPVWPDSDSVKIIDEIIVIKFPDK